MWVLWSYICISLHAPDINLKSFNANQNSFVQTFTNEEPDKESKKWKKINATAFYWTAIRYSRFTKLRLL